MVRRRRLRARRRGRRGELAKLLTRPGARAARASSASARRSPRHTQLDLPGDRLLQRGIEWSKQNLADSVQETRDLELREVNGGKNYPPPKATMAKARFVGAGFPDYPWLFATDGEFTAFASVALGQFEPIKEHMRALKEASNQSTTKRQGRPRGRHGRLGLLRRQRRRGQHRRDRQVPERRRADLALDRRRRLPRRDVRLREVEPAVHLPRARQRQRRLAGGPRQRRAARHGRGEARQHRPRRCAACATSRTSPVQGRHGDREVGGRQGRRARVGLRDGVVDGRDPAARRLARATRNAEDPAAPLDRRHADGDRDRARRPAPSPA